MQRFFMTLLSCSVSMTALMILYLAVTPLLAKRYSARSRYVIWQVILLGLIIPFRPEISFSFVKVAVNQVSLQPGDTPPLLLAEPVLHTSGITAWQGAAILWLCGAFGFLLFHLLRHQRFIKTAERWNEELSGREAVLLTQEKQMLGIRRDIGLYRCPVVPGPMLLGFWRPRILLPELDLSDRELCLILRHELIHFKRGDLYVRAAVLLATAIHWFNPAVHICGAAVNEACEASCDAQVIQGLDNETRKLYGKTILRAACRNPRSITALSTNFNGGKKKMKKRLTAVLDSGLKKTGAVLVVIALLLSVTSGVVMAAAGSATDAEIEIPEDLSSVAAEEEEDGLPQTIMTNEDETLMIRPVSGRIDKKGVKAIVDSLKPGSRNLQCVIYDGKYYRAFVLNEGMMEEKMGVYSDPEEIGEVFEGYMIIQQIVAEEYELNQNEEQQ